MKLILILHVSATLFMVGLIWFVQVVHFVIAKRLGLESWRECLDREIAWVLNLNRSRDYIISSMARLHLEELLPSSEQQNGGLFVVEFFITDLYGKSASTIVDSDPATRWLTSAEVLAGTTADGRTVSPTLVSLLRKADVIAPHTH